MRRRLIPLAGWLALAGVLTLPDGGKGRAQQPQPPMRVNKDQIAGALKLMGLEFQDAEMETMLRGVNQALGNYEALRKTDVVSGEAGFVDGQERRINT